MQRISAMSRPLTLVAALLLVACASEPKDPIDSHEDPSNSGGLVLLIERESGEGPYVAGSAERFKVVASNDAFKSVTWSASAGGIEPDGEQVTWTLPLAGTASLAVSVQTESGKQAEGTFNFQVVEAPLVADPAIDPSPDVTGTTCELAFDNSGKGYVVYRNETHRSLWFGIWDGTTWKTEQIDGPGYGNDGDFTWKPAFVLDPATGTPHVAYFKGREGSSQNFLRTWYATRVNNAWVRELADATARPSSAVVSLALNPAQGMQPSLVFGNGGVRVATRTAPNTWTSTVVTFPASSTAYLMGHVSFDAAGTLYVPFTPGSGLFLGSVRGTITENFSSGLEYFDPTSLLPSVVWGPSQHLLLLASQGPNYSGGLQDITVSTPLSSSTAKPYSVDAKNDASDLAYAGKPYIVARHGTNLELITPDAQNFWTYTQLGTVQDGSRPSVAIRPTDGVPHVCYQRDNTLRFQ